MSDNVFPALKTLQSNYAISAAYKTIIHTTASGKEDRTAFAVKRRTYSLTYRCREAVMASPPWQAYSERDIIQKFHDDHYGALDSFLFVDPAFSVQVRVRFADDELEWRRVAPGLWEVSIELQEVASGGVNYGGALDGGEGLYG